MMMVDVAVTVMMMSACLFDFGTTHTTTSSSSVVGSRRVGGQSRRGNRFPFLVMMVSVNGVVAVVFAGGSRIFHREEESLGGFAGFIARTPPPVPPTCSLLGE